LAMLQLSFTCIHLLCRRVILNLSILAEICLLFNILKRITDRLNVPVGLYTTTAIPILLY
jgi:hypothetical protein